MTNHFKTISKAVLLLSIIVFFLGCGLKHVKEKVYPVLKPFPKEQRYIIAVLPFKYESEFEEYKDLVNKIPDKLISELYNTKRFRIIERARLNEILNEIALGQTGLIDQNQAIKIGKQLGAEMVLVGSLTNIKLNEFKKTLGVAYVNTMEVDVDIDARLISIERGEVEVIAKATGKDIQEKKVAFGASIGNLSAKEAIINTAIDRAIKDLTYNFAKGITPKKN